MSVGKIEVNNPTYFKWIINTDSFASCTTGVSIKSPRFYNLDYEFKKNEWRLEFYPKGNILSFTEANNYVSVFLAHLNENDINHVSFTISILNQDNDIVVSQMASHNFKTKEKDWGWSKFLEQSFMNDPKNKILKNNEELVILCKIINTNNKKENEAEFENMKNLNRLQDLTDFEELLMDKQFSDVTIRAENKSFYVHKCILALRSPVFKVMFDHDMMEKNQNAVEIEDIKCEVLQEFLQFIYTGKVNDIEKIVDELLITAEKYDVKGLKKLCEETMCRNLSCNNALEYLDLAILNNSEKLKNDSIEFISLYLENIIKTPEFDKLEDPKLLKEIMKKHFLTK